MVKPKHKERVPLASTARKSSVTHHTSSAQPKGRVEDTTDRVQKKRGKRFGRVWFPEE